METSELLKLIGQLEEKKRELDSVPAVGESCPPLRQYASAMVENGSLLLRLARAAVEMREALADMQKMWLDDECCEKGCINACNAQQLKDDAKKALSSFDSLIHSIPSHE